MMTNQSQFPPLKLSDYKNLPQVFLQLTTWIKIVAIYTVNGKLGNGKVGNEKLGSSKLGNRKIRQPFFGGVGKVGNGKMCNGKLGNVKVGNR